ncbi:MAG: RND transporter [Hyphomonas sp. 34-62-18]|nr:efflux transporter outer membrane subunit [Hyphomonas sp. 34-62-18]OYW87745.1 MAG: RND transporter [Hyphomonas sp. 32-62-5]OZB18905.1 MAG: RND transporter [Hyphomonas sp. 34-62-18]
MIRALLISASALALAGCASINPVQRETATDAGLTMPDGYDYAAEVAGLSAPEQVWWAGFNSADLDALITEALTANNSLAQGLANVDASRASLKTANAAFLPQASGSLSSSSNTEAGLDDVDASARLSASYQLDLFGANAASRNAALANLDAAIFAQRALELTVQSDVAAGWFNLLAAREQLAVARRNLEISERIFQIVQVRYEAGTISGFDVSSQAAQLANARARIPQLESQITSQETALAILLGRVPQGYAAPQTDILTIDLPSADPGLPSDLLLRRPDLMQSEASLRAANANIDAARAAFFPSIDLGAGLSSVLTGGTDLVGSLSASVAQTIFSGGRLDAQLESAQARREGQLAAYHQSILSALRDVDVSLKAVEANAAREEQLLIARDAAQDALRAAEIQYQAGTGDLTSLLNAQQNYFDAANSYVLGRLDRLTAAINLYVAVGGGY